jgi:hypothetical protein
LGADLGIHFAFGISNYPAHQAESDLNPDYATLQAFNLTWGDNEDAIVTKIEQRPCTLADFGLDDANTPSKFFKP